MNKSTIDLNKDFFNIKDLSKMIKRETQTIRLWEKNGIINKSDMRADNNWRLYSKQCVISILEQIINYNWKRNVIKNKEEIKYIVSLLKENKKG